MIELKARTVIGGNGIFLVSVPVAWSRTKGVKKGDKLKCFIDDAGNLLLKKV